MSTRKRPARKRAAEGARPVIGLPRELVSSILGRLERPREELASALEALRGARQALSTGDQPNYLRCVKHAADLTTQARRQLGALWALVGKPATAKKGGAQ